MVMVSFDRQNYSKKIENGQQPQLICNVVVVVRDVIGKNSLLGYKLKRQWLCLGSGWYLHNHLIALDIILH